MRKILPLLALLSVPSLAAQPGDYAEYTDTIVPSKGAVIVLDKEEPHRSHFSVGIGPAWVHVLRGNYLPAFTNNGFAAPGNDRVGLDFMAYWTTESRWQVGVAMTSFSFEQDVGSYAADYSNGMFGLYAARDFSQGPDSDLTAGAVLGWNSSVLDVFASNQSGRLRESAAVIAPTVGYASRISPLFKLGLRGSYFIPFGESSQSSGQSLGVSKISARGFLLSLQLILSRI